MGACSKPADEDPPAEIIDVVQSEVVQNPDAEINAAMVQARETYGGFVAESSNPDTAGTSFMCKVRVREGEVFEDIWVSHVESEGPHYSGIVGDFPSRLTGIAMTDRIRFSVGQLIEWQYFTDKVVGAQVTRVLRSRMPQQERNEKDLEYPVPFE